jgi:hypothetical protein
VGKFNEKQKLGGNDGPRERTDAVLGGESYQKRTNSAPAWPAAGKDEYEGPPTGPNGRKNLPGSRSKSLLIGRFERPV